MKTAPYRRWPPTQPSEPPAVQLDLLEAAADQAAETRLRDLYRESGAIYDTDVCHDGTHSKCTGIVHIHSGDVLHGWVSPLSGPCRCTCHD